MSELNAIKQIKDHSRGKSELIIINKNQLKNLCIEIDVKGIDSANKRLKELNLPIVATLN